MKTLEVCYNAFGDRISSECQKRIRRFLNNPTPDNWDDISSIIIDTKFHTIWEAVIALDSTFPRRGRVTDAKGRILEDWQRIPRPLQVLQAIEAFTAREQ
jgi:hypothetical protein